MLNDIYNQSKLVSCKEEFETNVLKIWNKFNIDLNTSSQTSSKLLKQLKELQYKQTGIQKDVFIDSKLITDKFNKTIIRNFFSNKNIQETKLLFRASQHDFKANKFHQKCDHIPHTLVICQNQFGKKIGGYTPLTWIKRHQDQYLKDESGDSFIFSLTKNQKLPLIPGKEAICRSCKQGPVFGGYDPDFYINDESNIQNSYAKINQSYKSDKKNWYLSVVDEQSFTGAGDKKRFKIKQWEVWQLKF